MYNLAIAFAIALVLFGIGAATTSSLVAGFIPALLALGISYVLLARRSGQKLQKLMEAAMVEFQAGRVEKGRKILESGYALQKWQFLISAQIHAQLGAIDYMQRRYKQARVHLEKAWSRHWMAQAMLATLDFREKKIEAALERMEKTRGPGGSDPVFWGLFAYFAVESGDRERALRVLADGIKKHASSEPLKGMADAVRNKKKLKMKAFGQGWFQFFPEHIPRSMLMQMQAAANKRPGGGRGGKMSIPHPRR